jgi:hypothetical protein
LLFLAIDSEMSSDILADGEELYTAVSLLLVRRGARLDERFRGETAVESAQGRGHFRFLDGLTDLE